MDPKKAYGVEQALGKALAKTPDALETLRATATAEACAAWLATLDAPLPAALVAEYLSGIPPQEWPKTRAKLVLATKLALGAIEAGHGHEAGKGVRKA